MASLPDYFDKIAKMLRPGDAFELFIAELFQKTYPGLRPFPPGKDGAVDLLLECDDHMTVFQAKAITGSAKGAMVAINSW